MTTQEAKQLQRVQRLFDAIADWNTAPTPRRAVKVVRDALRAKSIIDRLIAKAEAS